jgi:hypothetical protein
MDPDFNTREAAKRLGIHHIVLITRMQKLGWIAMVYGLRYPRCLPAGVIGGWVRQVIVERSAPFGQTFMIEVGVHITPEGEAAVARMPAEQGTRGRN